MKRFATVLTAIALFLNLLIVSPAFADRPKLTATPEYTEVTTAIADLLKAKETPDQTDLSATEIEQKLGALNLQKYILETASHWSQCSNQTGKTIAVFAHKAKTPQPRILYYLANGEMTDDDWNCDAVYLPTGTTISGQSELTEPVAAQFVSGSQLVAKTNAAGELEFNLDPAKLLKAGEGNLMIPNLTLASVETTTPNAPIED